MHDLTGFQRDVLFVLSGLEKPKGLAIKAELDEYYESEINHGRLYPSLDTLVKKGLISKGKYDDRTNEYTLTNRGERELQERRKWENHHLQGVADEPPVT